MVFLMNKQTKILENQRIQAMHPRIPQVNKISEKIISQIQRKPLYDPERDKKHSEETVKQVIDADKKKEINEKVQGFIRRNYEREVKMKAQKYSEAA